MKLCRRQLRKLILREMSLPTSDQAFIDQMEKMTDVGKVRDVKDTVMTSVESELGQRGIDAVHDYSESYLDVFDDLRAKGVTEDELRRVIAAVKAQFV